MAIPQAFSALIEGLGRLPGVGRKTAERMALRLVRDRDGLCRELAYVLESARTTLRCCSRCGSVTGVGEDPCAFCTEPGRDSAVLCVVEEPSDILAVEASGGYRGGYHALMGKLSPMRGDGAQDLRISGLLTRIQSEGVREVILALGTDVEGDATASYLAECLKSTGVRVTRPAHGLPAGSGVGYSDPVTLARALRGRQSI